MNSDEKIGTFTMDHYELKTPDLSHVCSGEWSKVYQPAEDTFLMLDTLEQDFQFIIDKKPLVCLEIGSGSGVLITALSQQLGSKCHCMAIDVNKYACNVTSGTSRQNDAVVEVLQADLTKCLKKFCVDFVLFNPPYVVTDSRELVDGDELSKSWAGGINGREVIDKFLSTLDSLMSVKGFGYLLLTHDNNPDQVKLLVQNKGFICRVQSNKKVRGEHLFVLKFFRR